jgi:hypothetical protein
MDEDAPPAQLDDGLEDAAPTASPAAAPLAAAAASMAPPRPEYLDIEPTAPVPTEEFCRVGIWRGYAKARFYASLELGDGDDLAVAESQPFRLRGNGTPDRTKRAEEAHQALVAELLADGWEPVDDVGPWYAGRFRRELESEQQP